MPTSPTCIILIAEDDEDDRYLLTQAFAKHQPNCQVRFFPDGQQLLNALNQSESKFHPSLILLDLNMPILDGLTTLKFLKNDTRLRKIPVLMLTTSDAERDVKQCYTAGANAYMSKPATYSELAHTIDQTLQYWLKITHLPSGR